MEKPTGYEKMLLGPDGLAVVLQKGRLTFLSKGAENSIALPDWLRLKFTRDDANDLWVAQATMKDWDRAFFTYTRKSAGKWVRDTFSGPHAPKLPEPAKTLIGTLQTISFPSKEIGESRDITVYLPPNPGPNLKAVYMADGQSCAAFARVLEPLILAKKVAPTAIVGLFHGEYKGEMTQYDMSKDFRAREYLKVADPERFESHLRFVTEEVLPWAESKFGLATGPANRALFGFSNGAAFAVVASAERPDVFSSVLPFSVAAFDPDELRKTVVGKRLPRYWLAAGTLETFIGNTKSVEEILRNVHAPVRRSEFVAGHDEAMWRLGFAQALPKVFPYRR